MERESIIKGLMMFFQVEELLCPHCFKMHGDDGMRFLSTPALANLLFLRSELLKSPIYINNYRTGGSFSQRGLRCNLCSLTHAKSIQNTCYLSAHLFGSAFDFDCLFYSADTVRRLILQNASSLPYPLRLESGIDWVHFDTFNYESASPVVLFFAKT